MAAPHPLDLACDLRVLGDRSCEEVGSASRARRSDVASNFRLPEQSVPALVHDDWAGGSGGEDDFAAREAAVAVVGPDHGNVIQVHPDLGPIRRGALDPTRHRVLSTKLGAITIRPD